MRQQLRRRRLDPWRDPALVEKFSEDLACGDNRSPLNPLICPPSTWCRFAQALAFGLFVLSSCRSEGMDGPGLSSARRTTRPLELGERYPDLAENEVVGTSATRVARGSSQWQQLIRCQATNVLFKDEEKTGADRRTVPALCERLGRLGTLVTEYWPGLSLRVTEAWDENGEHGRGSLHYEGRAADLTVSDLDASKLGRLGQLAVQAGFDWVYFENRAHVHVSVRRDAR